MLERARPPWCSSLSSGIAIRFYFHACLSGTVVPAQGQAPDPVDVREGDLAKHQPGGADQHADEKLQGLHERSQDPGEGRYVNPLYGTVWCSVVQHCSTVYYSIL